MKLETALAIYALLSIGYIGIWSLAGFFNGGFRMFVNPFWCVLLLGSLGSAGYLIVQHLQSI